MNPPHVHLPWSQNMRSVGNEAPPIEWTCSEEKRVGSEGHHVERNIRMGSYISNEVKDSDLFGCGHRERRNRYSWVVGLVGIFCSYFNSPNMVFDKPRSLERQLASCCHLWGSSWQRARLTIEKQRQVA